MPKLGFARPYSHPINYYPFLEISIILSFRVVGDIRNVWSMLEQIVKNFIKT